MEIDADAVAYDGLVREVNVAFKVALGGLVGSGEIGIGLVRGNGAGKRAGKGNEKATGLGRHTKATLMHRIGLGKIVVLQKRKG